MSDQESFRDKVCLLLIDKIVLGAMAGIVACLFAWYLQSAQLQADYQKQMFERRVDAYETTLAQAKKLSDELLVFVTDAKSNVGVALDEILWQKRFNDLQAALERERGTGSGGSGSTWTAPDFVLTAFRDFETVRSKNTLHFSTTIRDEMSVFMDTLWREFMAAIIKKPPPDNRDEVARCERVRAAYERLGKQIRERLAADKIILG